MSKAQVIRYDSGEFSKPIRTPNGYLKCDAVITKTGVFSYLDNNGKTRLELRHPEEVFRDDSLSSFEDVPLTNNHPREKLDAKNTRRFQAGNIKSVRRQDGLVAANVVITDEDAIKDVEAGKTQLSCGYRCDLDFTPGVTFGIEGIPDGTRYDAIQRNIVGNHVAIVDRGRAGSDASLRLDSDDAVMIDDEDKKPIQPENKGRVGGKKMAVFKIDGVDFEMSEQAIQAVSKKIAHADHVEEQNKKLVEDVSAEKARADKAEEDLASEKEARKNDVSDEKIREFVRNRVALERTASSIVKDEKVKLDEMSDQEIKKVVVIAVSPSAKERLDSCDDTYLNARYDAAIEAWKDAEANKQTPSHLARVATVSVGNTKLDAKSARERMLEYNYKIGRDPIRPTTIGD